MRELTIEDWMAEGEKLFGKDIKEWQFVCPRCKTIQSGQDLLDAGVKKEKIDSYVAFSCIGRFNKGETGCDWTLGGLFTIHKTEIIIGDKKRPVFEFAKG